MARYLVQPCMGSEDIRTKRQSVEAPSAQEAAEAVLNFRVLPQGEEAALRARVYPEHDLETSAVRLFYAAG